MGTCSVLRGVQHSAMLATRHSRRYRAGQHGLAHKARAQKHLSYVDAGGRKISFFTHFARRLSYASAGRHGLVLLAYATHLGRRAERKRVGVTAAAGAA